MKPLPVIILLLMMHILSGCGTSDTLDRIPPEVTVNDPDTDEIGAPIVVTVNATDNVSVAGVSLYIDGVFLDRKTAPPYSFYWYSDYWGDGKKHLLTASALDPSGNIGTSKPVTVEVLKTLSPTVDIISPLHNAVIGEERLQLRWKPIENTVQYEVQVSDTVSPGFAIIDTKTTASSVTIDLPEEKTYVWRVRPASIGNIVGGWGKDHLFHRTGQFTSIIGSKRYDALNAITAISGGGLLFSGSTHSLSKGGYLVKMSSAGKIEWERFVGGTDASWFTSAVQMSDGGFLAAGQNTSQGALPDQWFVKTDGDGFLQWSKTILLPGSQSVNSLIRSVNDGVIVCGVTDTDSNNTDIVVTQYDASFEKIWERTYGGRFHDEAFQIIGTSDGGAVLAGMTQRGSDASSDCGLALRLNSLGEEVWRQEIPSAGGTQFRAVALRNGILYFSGFSRTPSHRRNAVVTAIDSSGNILWTKIFGGTLETSSSGIALANNGIVIAGSIDSDSLGIKDVWLSMISYTGTELWNSSYGGSSFDAAAGILPYQNGFALVGSTTSFTSGSSDGFVIITDAQGKIRQFPP